MSAFRATSQAPPTFDGLTPESVAAETKSTLTTTSAVLDELTKNLSASTAPFTNLVQPIIDNANRAASRLRILDILLASVSPESSLRDASRETKKYIEAAETANLMRRDIAKLVTAVFENPQEDDALDAETATSSPECTASMCVQERIFRIMPNVIDSRPHSGS